MSALLGVWNTFHNLFIPSQANVYRPRVLHRSWLVFFLAVMLMLEGFLMTNLATRQSNEVFLASPEAALAGTTPTTLPRAYAMPSNLAASPAGAAQSLVQQTIRVLGDPKIVNPVLEAMAVLLTLALLFAFFIHIQIQPKDMLAGGALVLGLALLFIYSNSYVLPTNASDAQNSVVVLPGQSQMAEAAASL